MLIERPMVNPKRFAASTSALRALEATLITVEDLDMAYQFVDSKQWQRVFFPGVKGSGELKKASLQYGKQFFPSLGSKFEKDADGILIAEWGKRTNL